MDSLKIYGGTALKGEIAISGAKNAALPLLACGLMIGTKTLRLGNVPDLADTRLMLALLSHLGVEAKNDGDDLLLSGMATSLVAPYDLVNQMRASILVMGPLLARYGEAKVSLPGGVLLALGQWICIFARCKKWVRLLNWQMDMFRHARPKG